MVFLPINDWKYLSNMYLEKLFYFLDGFTRVEAFTSIWLYMLWTVKQAKRLAARSAFVLKTSVVINFFGDTEGELTWDGMIPAERISWAFFRECLSRTHGLKYVPQESFRLMWAHPEPKGRRKIGLVYTEKN